MADDLVVAATFGYRYEAEIAHNLLESAGIESILLIDDAGGMDVGLSFTNRARIMVRSEDVERARTVLGEDESDRP